MDSLYREIILEHHKSPHNFGTLDPADYTAEDTNPLCGDQIRVDLRVVDNIVTEVAFTGRGCAVSIASASMLTDMIKGMTLDEVRAITKDDLLEEIGIPVSPARIKCATLGLNVMNLGIALKEAHKHEHAASGS